MRLIERRNMGLVIMKRGDRVALVGGNKVGTAHWFYADRTMVVQWDGDAGDSVVFVEDVTPAEGWGR